MPQPQPSNAPRNTILAGALAAALGTVAFVKPWEGRELEPYRDIVGVLTWCDGETSGRPKDRYTDAECDAITQNAVARHLRQFAACVNRPLRENEWVALGSWVYNVGVNAACRSTLTRKINAGAPASAWCPELLKWDRAGGRRIRGLTRRRQAEYRECMRGE